mgnify:CR=1 FL=1
MDHPPQTTPAAWGPDHERILVDWGDKAMCFRWMHRRAHEKFQLANMWFTIPVIVLSTITGTANRTARQTAQNRHREWLHRPEQSALCARARRELRGLRLGCWCEQPGPCHGHNLCEVADADIDDDADGTAL